MASPALAPHAGHGHAIAHPAGPHIHEHGGHAHVHDERSDAIAFYAMVFGMVGMQLLLRWWQRTRPRSFALVSLMLLWIIPFATAIVSRFWRFPIAWLAYSAVAAYFVRMARERPLRATTPKKVYRFFEVAYAATTRLAAVGYICAIVVLTPGIASKFTFAIMDLLLHAVIYGVYFGVVTRDLAELAAETMASSLGYSKKDDGDSARPVPRGLCALCGEDLLPAGGEEEGGDARQQLRALEEPVRAPSVALGPTNAAPVPVAAPRTVRLAVGGGSVIYKLECGHIFHGPCILGWCVVGKKGTCPCCLERVDLRAVVGDTMWARSSLLWTQLMDFVRYGVVWVPMVSLAVRLLLWEAGVSISSTILLSNATTAVNGTEGASPPLIAAQ